MKPTLSFASLSLVTLLATAAPAVAADARMAESVGVPHVKEHSKPQTTPAPVGEGSTVKAEDAAPAKVEPAAEKAMAMPVAAGPVNYVGKIQTYKASSEDTLLTIGEKFGLGYVEMCSANPSMDPWRPGDGTFMILPTMHLLPDAPRKGIVVNLSEMRLYYYSRDGVKTYPIGVGREGFSTPVGTTSVTNKVTGPVWRPTDRMRREDPTLPPQVGPGPENPLGTHALYLGWPQYLLHGTNKPWGIGRRVSSGCVRMYNRDAETLFQTVGVGTQVSVVRQPIKFGWVGDMLYVEAHPDEDLADEVERAGAAQDYKVPSDIFANISRAAGAKRDQIDWKAVRAALKERRGYPVPVLVDPKDDQYFVTAAMEARSGTSRFGPRLTQGNPPQPIDVQAQGQNKPAVEVGDHDAKASDTSVQQPASPRRKLGQFNG